MFDDDYHNIYMHSVTVRILVLVVVVVVKVGGADIGFGCRFQTEIAIGLLLICLAKA